MKSRSASLWERISGLLPVAGLQQRHSSGHGSAVRFLRDVLVVVVSGSMNSRYTASISACRCSIFMAASLPGSSR